MENDNDNGFITVTRRGRRSKTTASHVEKPTVTSAPRDRPVVERTKKDDMVRLALDSTDATKPAAEEKKCLPCGDAGQLVNDCPAKTTQPIMENTEVSANADANVNVNADVNVSADVKVSADASVSADVNADANVSADASVNADVNVSANTDVKLSAVDNDNDFITVTKRVRRPKKTPSDAVNEEQQSVTSAPRNRPLVESSKKGNKGGLAGDRKSVTKTAAEGKKCFSCGDAGHMINDCPVKTEKPRREQRERQPVVCYNCNQSGHVIRDCPEERKTVQGKKCFSCGDAGHMIYDCPTRTERPRREQRERQPVICYNCNQSGHVVRDCPEERKAVQEKKCYGCGGSDHLIFDCPSRPSEPRATRRKRNFESVECYNCGERGHMARECHQEGRFHRTQN